MTHVPGFDIERLARGRLTTADSLRVQRHLFRCGSCLKKLITVELRLAEQELIDGPRGPVPDPRKPVFLVHDTADGLVYSRAERCGRKWLARHWGPQLEGARECETLREANAFLIEAFSQMFPEHRCTERCRIQPHGRRGGRA